MSKQKSMGEIAHNMTWDLGVSYDGWVHLSVKQKRKWVRYVSIIISEHERRKRANAKKVRK